MDDDPQGSLASRKPPVLLQGRARKRFFFGLLVLLGVVAIWVGSSELQQVIYVNNFNKPFFLTYYSTSMFCIYFVGFLVKSSWRRQCRDWLCARRSATLVDSDAVERANLINRDEDVESPASSQDGRDDDGPASTGRDGSDEPSAATTPRAASETPVEMLTMAETARAALIFCLLWFAANYTFNLSLTMTSVSSNTIISSTSGFFTLILGALFGRSVVERFSLIKLVSVGVSIGGVALVSLSDTRNASSSGSAPLTGDLIALVSAFLYGVYMTFLKRAVETEDRVDMPLFFGFVGAFNVVLMLPFFFILNATGLEVFEWPPDGRAWGFLTLYALVGTVLSDYLWLWSTLLTSPLIATLGLSLTIPVALTVDTLRKVVHPNWLYGVGTLLVFASFVVVNLASVYDLSWSNLVVLCHLPSACVPRIHAPSSSSLPPSPGVSPHDDDDVTSRTSIPMHAIAPSSSASPSRCCDA